jgi:hypothetical protein
MPNKRKHLPQRRNKGKGKDKSRKKTNHNVDDNIANSVNTSNVDINVDDNKANSVNTSSVDNTTPDSITIDGVSPSLPTKC